MLYTRLHSEQLVVPLKEMEGSEAIYKEVINKYQDLDQFLNLFYLLIIVFFNLKAGRTTHTRNDLD